MFSDEIVFDGYCSRVVADTSLADKYHLFISAVDSISARKEIWKVIAKAQVDWYCDMRMAAEEFQMYLVDMQDFQAIERYHEQLMRLNEDDIQELPCTAKATFHCSMAAAGHVGTILRDIVRGEATSYRLIHYIVDERIVTVNL